MFIGGLGACRTSQQFGQQKRLRLGIGEIEEVSFPQRGDGSTQLIGASDNQEVVEVSRRELAPAVDTLKRDGSGPAVFQLKGVTLGTAKVIFSEKKAGEIGSGEALRTYTVEVVTKK
ncbi:hypothetical protein HNV11_16235 [Spirosoma taeanense]|uniref:Uncharacterized protein n=1 Tax=Spirosoma taeanense TaxID=2735870 RepID=A0A6M5YEJ0_9BACT|nr:hypothetical protein HNV11_16235 [Spirosoma taeanense]